MSHKHETFFYILFIRNLVVMLLKKYERTTMLENLDRAILFAEVMLTVTPSLHPDKSQQLMDLSKMKFRKALKTCSAEDYDEAMVMLIDARTMV